jgi:hypothetical protein
VCDRVNRLQAQELEPLCCYQTILRQRNPTKEKSCFFLLKHSISYNEFSEQLKTLLIFKIECQTKAPVQGSWELAFSGGQCGLGMCQSKSLCHIALSVGHTLCAAAAPRNCLSTGGQKSLGGWSCDWHLVQVPQVLDSWPGPLCSFLLQQRWMRSGRKWAGALTGALAIRRLGCLHQHLLLISVWGWLPVSPAPKLFVDTGKSSHGAGAASGEGNRLVRNGIWCCWLWLTQ